MYTVIFSFTTKFTSFIVVKTNLHQSETVCNVTSQIWPLIELKRSKLDLIRITNGVIRGRHSLMGTHGRSMGCFLNDFCSSCRDIEEAVLMERCLCHY